MFTIVEIWAIGFIPGGIQGTARPFKLKEQIPAPLNFIFQMLLYFLRKTIFVKLRNLSVALPLQPLL